MDKGQILELLKTINYPGFSRDIVSFGIVENIKITEKTISLKLKLPSQSDEMKQQIISSIKKKLEAIAQFEKINIISESVSTKSILQQPSVQQRVKLNGEIQHIVAVASGKGGVGKSTVAANLAAALQLKGKKGGLLDLDIYGPSLPIIFGINEAPRITSDKKLIPVEKYGLRLMSFGFISGNNSPVIWRGPMVAKMTEQFFSDVEWGKLDYLILDLPPGTGDVQLTLTQQLKISGVIIVTTPQDIALADVRKSADMFSKVGAPILGVVENMSGLLVEGKVIASDEIKPPVKIEIKGKTTVATDKSGNFSFKLDIFKKGGGRQESKRLDAPLLADVPLSAEIVNSTDSGKPIVLAKPSSLIAEFYHKIADKIINQLNQN